MNKAQRAELLRQRFKTKAGKWQYVGTGPKRKAAAPAKPAWMGDQSFGLALSHHWGRTEWLQTSDTKPTPQLGNRNRKGVPALTAIAAKQPKKLVRAYRDADELLAQTKF